MIAAIDEIKYILKMVKIIVDDGDDYIFIDRDKNRSCLLKLEYTPDDVKEIIRNLDYKDYSQGPDIDYSKKNDNETSIWIFGKKIKDLDIYIKLSITQIKDIMACVCISFHEQELAMNFPYKEV